MRELAFLNKGIKIIFTDASLKKEKVSEFKFDGGVLEFVDFLDEKEKNYKIKMEMIYLKNQFISKEKKTILNSNVL